MPSGSTSNPARRATASHLSHRAPDLRSPGQERQDVPRMFVLEQQLDCVPDLNFDWRWRVGKVPDRKFE